MITSKINIMRTRKKTTIEKINIVGVEEGWGGRVFLSFMYSRVRKSRWR